MTRPRAAVFLDRDGTIIEDREYLSREDEVVLLPGAGRAVAALNLAGIPVVLVTNQSGIGRGLFTTTAFDATMNRLAVLLALEGARVDGVYVCPHAPDLTPPCECRKPGTLLHRTAALEHGLDLARSFYIGDRWRDAAPALAFGGTPILIPNASTPAEERAEGEAASAIAVTLTDAVRLVLARIAAPPGPGYAFA